MTGSSPISSTSCTPASGRSRHRGRRPHLGWRLGGRPRPGQGGAPGRREASISGRWPCSPAARSRWAGSARALLRPARQSGRLHADLPSLRAARAVEARRPPRASRPRFHAVAAAADEEEAGRREFKRGILVVSGEHWEVRITGPQGSGILTSMTLANCLVVIEEERATWPRAIASRSSRSRWSEPDALHGIETELIEPSRRWSSSWSPPRPRARGPSLRGRASRGQRGQVRGRRERRGQGLRATTTPSPSGSVCWRARRMTAPGYFGRGLGAADVPHLARLLRDGLLRRLPARDGQRGDEGGREGQVRRPGRRRSPTPACIRRGAAGGRARGLRGGPARVALDDMLRLTTEVSRRVAGVQRRRSLQLRLDVDPAAPRAVRLLGGRAHRPVLRAHPGNVLRGGDGPRQQPGDLRRARPPARLGDPRARGVRAADRVPALPEFARAMARDAVELAAAPALPTPDRRGARSSPTRTTTRCSPTRSSGTRSSWTAGSRWRPPTPAAPGCCAASTTPAGQAYRLPAGERVLRPVPARLRPLRLRPRGHAGAAGRPHRPRGLHRLHEQPADRGGLRRRSQRALEGHRRLAGPARPHVLHRVRGGRPRPRGLIRDIDRGYFLVGHRTPRSRRAGRTSASPLARSTRSSAGRSGASTATAASWRTSRDFLMHVDGVGRDFRLYPIPNCGKGQPMQTQQARQRRPHPAQPRDRDRRSSAMSTSHSTACLARGRAYLAG